VNREHDRRVLAANGLDDRVDMVGERDRRAVGVGRFEPGQRDRSNVVAVGSKRGGDLVPGPRAEPEAGDEDDRCRGCVHRQTLGLAAAARNRWAA
jgi:hypothetical protein